MRKKKIIKKIKKLELRVQELEQNNLDRLRQISIPEIKIKNPLDDFKIIRI